MTNPNNPYGTPDPADPNGSAAPGPNAPAGGSLPSYGGTPAGPDNAPTAGYAAPAEPYSAPAGAYDNVPYPASYQEQNTGKNGWGVAALVIGILALLSLLVGFGPVIVGTIGIIVSIIALVRGRKFAKAGRRTGMSVTGLVLSLLSIVLMVVLFLFVFGAMEEVGVMDCATNGGSNADVQQCIQDRLENYQNSNS